MTEIFFNLDKKTIKPHLNEIDGQIDLTELSNTIQTSSFDTEDSSEKIMKNVSIDLKSQTESTSDSSDTTLKNKMTKILRHLQLLYPLSALPIKNCHKMVFPLGRNIKDVLYMYMSKLEYEQPAHSFIVDTSDDDIKNLFTKEE
ncbi:hypothetical protein Glove_735g5 [Diversispora epigaea]|uniref:Uncharacterized protein n=1 Tax=Diversispora epigaea TaxID=1348612 RepID=A0A397G8H6_9GLOM|nr:hypothetical protein Glove_735g5 [Diversispora epigaea]